MVGGFGSEAGKISRAGEDPYPRLRCGTLAIVNNDVLVGLTACSVFNGGTI